eukprot:3984667-Pleurochrysis_carterae.AAC.1
MPMRSTPALPLLAPALPSRESSAEGNHSADASATDAAETSGAGVAAAAEQRKCASPVGACCGSDGGTGDTGVPAEQARTCA